MSAPLALSGSVTVNRQGAVVWSKPGETITGKLEWLKYGLSIIVR